jgi:hypothetical protein
VSASAEARLAPLRALPGFGQTGARLVHDARVHVIGAGVLAGPALLVLAQAGVGTLYLDDGDDVAAADAAGWLLAPGAPRGPRLFAAAEALRAASALVEVRPHATGTSPTATLVCAPSEALAHLAAERARRAGVPHVVALGDGDAGEVVTVPHGAPCLACSSAPGARVQPTPSAAAALSTLAAVELLLVIARALPSGAGRRISLAAGLPRAEATARRDGCDCRNVY